MCEVTPRVRRRKGFDHALDDDMVTLVPVTCTLERIQALFGQPMRLAAEHLGICATAFKR